MKNRYIVFLCGLLIASVELISCGKKDLEIAPRNELPTEDALKNPDLLLNGIYALLGSGGITNVQMEGALYGTDILLDADLLAGEQYISWTGTFSQYRLIRSKDMIASNLSVVRIWRKAYQAINLANTLLNHLPLKDADKYKANALFTRGILHFELVRFFAKQYDGSTASSDPGVPLVLTATEDFDQVTYPSRSSVEDVYKQVILDLTEAKTLLGEDYKDIITSQTISAFLSRVYLQKGDYASALAASNEVIESGKFTLAGKIADVFNTNGSPEHIFVIEQTQNKNVGTSNDGLTTFYGCDPNIPASTGRGDVSIYSSFESEYDSVDTRRSIMIYKGTCTKTAKTSAKWKNPYTNIPIVRLAEMYLTRAECNFRLGSATGALPLDDINLIRTRASAPLFDVTAITLDTILQERALELAFEGFRIHDKRRVNAFFETDGDDGNIAVTYYREPQFIMPIPQVERNSNPNLVQNEGY